ncbi:hypothetical protein ABEW34_12145 [Paenibacillus algorifonticola]|uniref:hypothetical protein n=1 Tax=Paenibacillus algorifonticola TaxID=684063 RepID=UPI003D2ABBC2
MSGELMPTLPEVKKKSIFKKWWFWLLAFVLLIVIISVSSQGESKIYELSQMVQMNKQQIVEKFGKPDEVVRDDQDGYSYAYNGGFTVSGNDKGASNIVLSSAFTKIKSTDSYKIFDVQLDSSLQENIKRLGKPQLSLNQDDKNLVAYLTKEGYLLTFSSKYNEDKVSAIEISKYNSSTLSMALDISKMLNNQATENDIKQSFTINDKSTESKITTYYLDDFSLIVDNKDQTILEVIINSDSIFNILGLRTSDSLDKAVQLFGEPVQTADGVQNTTRYIFKVDNAGKKSNLLVTADNSSKKIQFVSLSIH